MTKLDQADAKLTDIDISPVGSGQLTLTGFLTPQDAGARVDYEQHVSDKVSVFGEGWAGIARVDPNSSAWTPDYGILGGVRIKF